MSIDVLAVVEIESDCSESLLDVFKLVCISKLVVS